MAYQTAEQRQQQVYSDWLDALRNSGLGNMFEGPTHLAAAFDLSKQEAVEAWKHWMRNFDGRHTERSVSEIVGGTGIR